MGDLEDLSMDQLKQRLGQASLSAAGTKSDLMVKLALWEHKSDEFVAGRVVLESMTENELEDLKQRLGLIDPVNDKDKLLITLRNSFETKCKV